MKEEERREEKGREERGERRRGERRSGKGCIHLLVDFLCAHASTEHGGGCKVASMARIRGSHHVLGIEHLLCELGDGE